MIIPSIPIVKAPVKPIILINSLSPIKNKNKGKKQVINQDKFLERPKSYHKIFFKVIPKARKEVKQVINPKRKPKMRIPSPATSINPDIPVLEVSGPETPRII